MRTREEEGQATILLVLAMSIFLLGAVGLAIDGSNLFWQRTMAQTAADAAAQAAMMSIFDGTNGSGSTAFPTTAFSCGKTYNASTPCVYASKNGFSTTNGDTISFTYPADATVSGISFSSDSVNLVQVTVTRSVKTTLMKLLGPSATTVEATAEAAIVTVVSPTPLLITDPVGSGSLSMNGSTSITICGGPSRSVEVNSSSSTALSFGGTIDLSKAGPADPGDCSSGKGADFGIFGGPATNPGVTLGSTGHYLSPASPIQDPYASAAAPIDPGGSQPATTHVANGTDGCTNSSGCTLYSPGHYSSLVPGKDTILFKPGLYYVVGGGVDFKQTVGGGINYSAMCTGATDCPADGNTNTGMIIYDTGATNASGFAASKGFTIDTQAQITLQGSNKTATVADGVDGCTATLGCSVPASPYYNILFWEDRSAVAQTHQLGQGNGCFTLIGTIYITNTQAIMTNKSDPNYPHTQSVTYNGTPCSTTTVQGDIIVGDLTLKGTVAIKMNLVPYSFLKIRQVALIN